MKHFASAVFVSCLLLGTAATGSQLVVLPLTNEKQAVLVPATLGVIVNVNDPQSLALGQEYARIRGIPAANIIELQLPKVNYVARHLMVRELDRLRSAEGYDKFKAFALAFDKPYKVDANQSITSAIAQGIATMTWTGNCNVTVENIDAGSAPGAALKSKAAMLLFGGGTFADTVALALRGKAADASDPSGDVFLVKTADAARSGPREASMDRTARLATEIAVNVVKAQTLSGKTNVMGFQIGLPVLKDIDSLQFRPGAYADHLTSFGGAIGDKKNQTPISALIHAGATASFGTVREPCNFPQKFPDPAQFLENYLHGDSILEAYWKSVGMMTEGLLVGEPLSRPFPVIDADVESGTITLKVNRHTLAFINDALQRSSQEALPMKASLGATSIGIYDVQTGSPRLLGKFLVKSDLKPGDLIGQLTISETAAASLVLGMLPQRQ